MIEIDIPGAAQLHLDHLVLDYNGTLAIDGKLIEGVADHLRRLSHELQIHIITADTFGGAREQLTGIDCKFSIIPLEHQDLEKLDYINQLGAEQAVAIGNGQNDRLMLEVAALGIVVIQREGAVVHAILAADIVMPGIIPALELLQQPLRVKATLRT